MIKKGDKIVCIKDYKFDHGFASGKFKKGNTYDYDGLTEMMLCGVKIDDYFITLAEWRNNQIDLVLNDS